MSTMQNLARWGVGVHTLTFAAWKYKVAQTDAGRCIDGLYATSLNNLN